MENDKKIDIFMSYIKNINEVYSEVYRLNSTTKNRIETEHFPKLIANEINISQFEEYCQKEILVFITRLETLKAMLKRSLQ